MPMELGVEALTLRSRLLPGALSHKISYHADVISGSQPLWPVTPRNRPSRDPEGSIFSLHPPGRSGLNESGRTVRAGRSR
jgi:hypothetical protein